MTRIQIKQPFASLLLAAIACLVAPLPAAQAGGSGNGAAPFTAIPADTATSANFASSPIVSIQSATPFAMISMSRDQSLDKKAYDDYTDLNNDGNADIGYEDAGLAGSTPGTAGISYYGYFDPNLCYTFNGTYFIPKEATDSNFHCNLNGTTNEWSGNFLNWSTMTRMDELRKILFGGLRSTDGTGASGITILQRQFLPSDGHSFAKYYNGNDINELTPFNLASTKYGSTCSDATGFNCGVTLCNTTAAPMGSGGFSEDVNTTTYPPVVRAAWGNYLLWNGSERWQCRWGEELQTLSSGNNEGTAATNQGSNGNNATNSGINAYPYSPYKNGTTSGHNPASAPKAGLSSTDGYGPDFAVLVQVCVSTLNTSDENCKQYPNGDLKPIGLLQLYGDDNEMYFGMMAGDYSSNKDGGSLTKNVGTLNDEVANTTDGHFLTYFPTGTCSGNACAGIINAISLYTTVGYSYNDGTYNNNDGSAGSCSWGLNTFASGTCVNWGNPYAEIYLATILYLNGAGVQGAFQANDSNLISGLYTPQSSGYKDPLSASTRCTSLNVVALNTGAISYDSNSLDGASSGKPGVQEIWGSGAAAENMTSKVGTDEGLAGSYFFGGTWNYTSNTFTGDGLCTPKTFTNLGAVNGVCPDAPRLQGSYNVAGIAFWAHTVDIRPTLSGNQLVTTYAVTLATGTPIMKIPVPGSSPAKTITLIPACQNTTVGGNCALVDFKIVSQNLTAGTGSFYVDWEDSEQGGDYDQDEWGVINYTIAAGAITVSTVVVASSTPYELAFGFVISGTSQDGFHAFSGINGYTYTDPISAVLHCGGTGGGGGSGCNQADATRSYAFTISGGSAQSFQDPLWYAAKYGAFQDQNGNLIPDLPGEWNCFDHITGAKNTNCGGTATPDGIPDTYFKANNPRALYSSLERVFENILAKTASGTAAAVVANARQGNGAIYQALYEPLHQDVHGNAVTWIGTLYSLFVDAFGNLREDGNHNAQMDDYTTDPVISIFFDPINNVTEFRRYIGCDPTKVALSTCSSVVLPLDQLNTVWNARAQLENMTTTQVTTQRTYTASAGTGRYIFTWLGARQSGGQPQTVDFVPSTFTATNVGYLNPDNSGGQTSAQELTQAQNIVNWVRGEEETGMRSRTVDYYNNNTYVVARLGDIVNSTPTVVGQPQEAFDILYNDLGYAAFRTQYQNRRTVVYLGSNDGMLHAFNGGFFDATNNSFTLSSLGGTGTETQHPLGAELWAYVPMDLLPHLKWLTQTNYPHVYYMDAKPRVFDAKIFTPGVDANGVNHVNGWGTVLVMGMRFGGSPVCINTDGSSLTSCPATGSSVVNPPGTTTKTTVFLQAAYVMMDITDPEHAPELMDEFFVPSNLSTPSVTSVLGFTTSYPTLSTYRVFTNNSGGGSTTDTTNSWYLLFGSGPTDLANAISNQDAQLFVYNLNRVSTALNWEQASIANKIVKDYDLSDSGSTQGFTGDPVSSDWDLNFLDNAVFFGTIGGTAATPTGNMYRLGVDETEDYTKWHAPQVLLALPSGQGETPTPSVSLDPSKNPWVYFGTGRFYVNADKSSSPQEAFYGIKDRNPSTTASVGSTITPDYTGELVDVSNALVDTSGNLSSVSSCLGGAGCGSANNTFSFPSPAPTTVAALQQMIDSGTTTPDGWALNFPASQVVTTVSPVPSVRNVSETALIGSIMLGTAYSPDPDLCGAEGLSNLYGLYYLTGTPNNTAQVFGTTTVSGKAYVLNNVSLGAGLASSPSLQVAKGLGNGQAEVYTQTSTGAIVQTGAVLQGNPNSSEISWQQPSD